MDNLGTTHGHEGHSTTRPPLFDGTNYDYWKNRMMIFLQAIDDDMWEIIEEGPTIPMKEQDGKLVPKPKSEWNEGERRKSNLHAKAKNSIICAVAPKEFKKISKCTTAKEMWEKLQITFEGTKQVRQTRINMLTEEYELFRMGEGEGIESMFERLSSIINDLHALGRVIPESDLILKILRSLPKTWQSKCDAIQEGNNLETLSYDELRGKLLAYEKTYMKESNDRRKRNIALKTSTSSQDDEEEDMEEFENENEEMAYLVKRFMNMYKRKNRQKPFFRKEQARKEQPRKEMSNQAPTCFECKKPGHIKVDCPNLKKKKFQRRPPKKRAMMATWDDDSSSSDEEIQEEEEGEEIANLCLMGKEHYTEVMDLDTPIPYDKLLKAFESLMDDSHKVMSKYLSIYEEKSSLEKELTILKNENQILKDDLDLIKR